MDGPARPIGMKNLGHSGIDVMKSRVGPNQAFTKLVGFVRKRKVVVPE